MQEQIDSIRSAYEAVVKRNGELEYMLKQKDEEDKLKK